MTKPTTLKRKGLQKLDLLLLVIESLDINGSESMLVVSRQIGIQGTFPHRVALWHSRCYNPLRRSTRRGKPSQADTEALIKLLCAMVERLYPIIRQLLSSKEPPQINKSRWNILNCRLKELIQDRMNTNLVIVQRLIDPQNIEELTKKLVVSLAFSTGKGGEKRLRESLNDPIFIF